MRSYDPNLAQQNNTIGSIETPHNIIEFRDGEAAVNDPDQKTHTYEVHPRKDPSRYFHGCRFAHYGEAEETFG